MNKDDEVVVFQENEKLSGKIVKVVNEKIVVVKFIKDNKEETKVGRKVHNWIEV